MTYGERPECDFSPRGAPVTICARCGQHTFAPLWVEKNHPQAKRIPFCGTACHEAYYLDHLRKGGL